VASGGLGEELTPLLRVLSVPFVGEALLLASRRGPLAQSFYEALAFDPSSLDARFRALHEEIMGLPGARECFLSTLRTQATPRGVRPAVVESLVKKLSSIRAPTMIVWGKQDRILPFAHSE